MHSWLYSNLMNNSTQKEKSGFYQKIRVIDGTVLKLIAMLTMVCDHVGDIFFPGAPWMRVIGRIAMPIFAFCIAEGYHYTHDRRKYLLRLGVFAVISELPFDLAFSGGFDWTHQNIMLTFFLAVLALILFDYCCGSGENKKALRFAAGCMPVVAICIAAMLLGTDYTLFGILTVWVFHIARKLPHPFRALSGVGLMALLRTKGVYLGTGLAFIPLALYNGKKGKGLKWLFYVFYPGHLLILFLLHMLLVHPT